MKIIIRVNKDEHENEHKAVTVYDWDNCTHEEMQEALLTLNKAVYDLAMMIMAKKRNDEDNE